MLYELIFVDSLEGVFFVPNNDAPFGPPQPSTASFARKLRELGLAATTIAQFREATASVD